MIEQQTSRVIVVLGQGRSGTSLLMRILGGMGMRLSTNMIPGRHENPDGFFEAADIVEIHKQLYHALYSKALLPLPNGWMERTEISDAKQAIRNVLQKMSQSQDSPWGFKDPRTSSFLPLWNRIFNQQQLTPVFILAVRNPARVISSQKRYYGTKEEIAELQWLQRNTDALHHSAADCFVVHYEDWFVRPVEVAQGLLQYTGLDQYFNGDINEALKGLIKPNLNRAVYDEYQVQNEYVLKLYDVLKCCRGDNFDRSGLMEMVKECRKTMDGFKGWYLEAQRHITQEADIRRCLTKVREQESKLKAKLEKERAQDQAELEKERAQDQAELEKERERVQKFESDLEEMVLENNHLLKTSKDYFEQAEEYRKHLASLKRENKDLRAKVSAKSNVAKKGGQPPPANDQFKKMQQEIIKLRYRYSFRLGKILTDAVLRPGKNTLLMPYFLAILSWDIVTGRGRRKMEQVLAEKKLA